MDTTDEDVRALIKSIHEDRLAAKDKEKRDSWTRYVSLMVVVLAVATAIGSLKSGGYGSKVMLRQSQASDTWALYQAKSIKQRIAELEAHGSDPQLARKAAADSIRYAAEEKDVEAKAKSLEAERDAAGRHGPPLGFSIASLQISIALASVCLITKRKGLWAAAGTLGTLGIGYLVYGLYFI
jgi:Flp pilus assembly protein TadB